MRQAEIDELKARVAALERQVAELKEAGSSRPRERDWRSTLGMFGDDPVMKQIFDEALKIREADREKARRHFAREDRAKKARQAKRSKKTATAGSTR